MDLPHANIASNFLIRIEEFPSSFTILTNECKNKSYQIIQSIEKDDLLTYQFQSNLINFFYFENKGSVCIDFKNV